MDKIYSSIKLNFASKKRQYWLIVSGLLLISITAYLVTLYFDYYQMRFYPRTYINELNISGLTQEEAQAKILAALNQQINFETDSLSFVYQDATLSANLKELGINSNLDEILQKAFLIGHQGNVIERLQQIVYNHLKPNKLYLGITYDQSVIQNLILEFKNQVDFAGEEPQLSLSHGTITVNSGQTANTLLNDETWQKIYEQLLSQKLNN